MKKAALKDAILTKRSTITPTPIEVGSPKIMG